MQYTKKSSLAILGGEPLVKEPFKPYSSIGEKEKLAVERVMNSGTLSDFYGSPSPQFMGGIEVQNFENNWAKRFNVPHVVSVNSATSGLYAAMGAIGISPGDEVIVPPYTMSATVMAPLIYGGIPIFADIDKDTYCLDLKDVEAKITERTRAILAVNLFGHPAPLHDLKKLAKKHNLYLVEDNAQGPLASEHNIYTGTIGDIGIFSLNYHKHVHTGEGGMCVTSNPELAQRLQLIRNHGENIVESYGMTDITNLIGFNYRLTELQAAIGLAQLDQIDEHVGKRQQFAETLSKTIENYPGLTAPVVREGCRSVYYCWVCKYDEEKMEVPREIFSQALKAEGIPNNPGYLKPLYSLPIFQQKLAFGRNGYPFNLKEDLSYQGNLCPVVEQVQQEILVFQPCALEINDKNTELYQAAFEKVYQAKDQLRSLSKQEDS